MSINQHQFEQLTEMGISLWQHRSKDVVHEPVNSTKHNFLDIDLNTLGQQQLFNDILLATGLTIGEISQQGDHLNLGLFNWYFIDTAAASKQAAHSDNGIQLLEQKLFTPSITELSKSPTLKKQLWLLLGNQA